MILMVQALTYIATTTKYRILCTIENLYLVGAQALVLIHVFSSTYPSQALRYTMFILPHLKRPNPTQQLTVENRRTREPRSLATKPWNWGWRSRPIPSTLASKCASESEEKRVPSPERDFPPGSRLGLVQKSQWWLPWTHLRSTPQSWLLEFRPRRKWLPLLTPTYGSPSSERSFRLVFKMVSPAWG